LSPIDVRLEDVAKIKGEGHFFVHFPDIVETGYRTLEEGNLVEFTVVQSVEGAHGVAVQPLERMNGEESAVF
jgi:cold shock CspA family protein